MVSKRFFGIPDATQRSRLRLRYESKECVASAWRASEKWPMSLNATIVPRPAPDPPKPLTVATDSLAKRSDGNTFAIVENAEYEKVAKPQSRRIFP